MNPLIAVITLEARRELSKKSFKLLILLAVLPIIVSLILRYGLDKTIDDTSFWAISMGFKTSGSPGMPEFFNLGSWMWVIALLFGGDLLASDLSDGTARLILSRGIKRWEYLAGKILTVTLVLVVITMLTGVAAYISNIILLESGAPPASELVKAVGLGAVLGVGALPLLLMAAIIGSLARKPVYGIVVGFIIYLVASIAVTIYVAIKLAPAVVAGQSQMEVTAVFVEEQMKAMAYIPYQAGLSLASILYWVVEGGVVADPIFVASGVMLEAGPLATAYTASTVIGIILHVAVLVYLIERMDL